MVSSCSSTSRPGCPGGEPVQQRAQRHRGRLRWHPGPEYAQLTGADLPHQVAEPTLTGEQLLRLAEQQLTGGGEAYLAAGPVEQLDGQLPFQPLDRLAQGRLGHPEQLRGPPEVQFVRDHHEVPQVPEQIHGRTLRQRRSLAAGYRAGVDVSERIEAIFAAVGVTASLHVVDVDATDLTPGGTADGVPEIGVRADDQVVIASIFKVLLVLEFARQVEAGQLDPTERVLVTADDRLGGWGLAGCTDDAEVSLRDLAYFAMSVTDNTAADLLLRRVGPDLLPMLAAELGLSRTRVLGGPRDLVELMLADVGARTEAEFARIFPTLPEERVRAMRVFDPEHTTSSTAREITRLLTLIWRDEAGPPAACAMVRTWMARQIFWTRLAAGFPPGVRVSGKTGTLPGLHLEAGVAEYPDGGRYAIAVFARADRLASRRIDVDLAMGEAARTAVEALRGD